MRLAVAIALLLGLATAAHAVDGDEAADADDPKPPQVRAQPWSWPDEDDPKLARGATRRPWWQITHDVPRVQLSYRRLWAASLDGGSLPFDAAGLDYYPVSSLIRFGIAGEFGWAGGTYGQWYAMFGATLGLQYPARVTPFFQGRFVAGLVGGAYQGQSLVSWMYQGGLETGIDVYCARRFYLMASVGWLHPVYGGVDVAALKADPTHPIRKDFGDDSFTFSFGLGL